VPRGCFDRIRGRDGERSGRGTEAGRRYSCGEAPGEGDDWWVEHIIPWADGGNDAPENLLPGCRPCNHLRLHHPRARFRLLLAVGDARVRETKRGSVLGKQVEAFMAICEARQLKRRKHPHLGLRSDAEVIQ
jgi:hypothetical protein